MSVQFVLPNEEEVKKAVAKPSSKYIIQEHDNGCLTVHIHGKTYVFSTTTKTCHSSRRAISLLPEDCTEISDGDILILPKERMVQKVNSFCFQGYSSSGDMERLVESLKCENLGSPYFSLGKLRQDSPRMEFSVTT